MEKKSYIVGVDIGSSNVVVAVGRRLADGTVRIEGVASRPVPNGVTSGRIDNVRSVGAAIREAKAELEEELGIRIDSAYAGISGNFVRCASYTDHVFIKDSAGCITKEDVGNLHDRMCNVVADDGELILDRIPQCYMVDDGKEIADPAGSFGRKLSATFLFVLCRKEQIERVKMSFHNAGLSLLDVCVNPAVLPAALLTDEERDEGVAVIDIGGGTTDVAVVRGNTLRYIVSIPIGASTINADMHAFGIAERNTEQVKKKYGSAVADMVAPDVIIPVQMPGKMKKDFLQVNLAAIIEARLKDIIEYAWDEIRSAKFSTKIPCGIVLTGGSALLDNIDELFRRETGVNVRLGKATHGIDEESQQRIGTYSHSTAVAVLLFGAGRGLCEVSERPATPAAPVRHTAEPAPAPRREAVANPVHTAPVQERPAELVKPVQQPVQPVEQPTEPETREEDIFDDEERDEEKSGLIGRVARWINETVLGNGRDKEYL